MEQSQDNKVQDSTPNNKERSRLNIVTPLLISCAVALGMWLGADWDDGRPMMEQRKSETSLDLIFNYIENEYVDTVDEQKLIEQSINEMLNGLDPYSTYIPSRLLRHVNEPLEGKFEGIGIEFLKLKDTVTVVAVIPGGPSEMAGLLSGDKIIRVDGEPIAGQKLDNASIISKLKGPRGTKVKVDVLRFGIDKPLILEIIRDKITINSVETSFLLKDDVGYIKLNKFSALTAKETNRSIRALKEKGMTKLILDLRDNPGGYLDAAVSVADEFIKDGSIITYTKGLNKSRETYSSSTYGDFESGPLVVLIDEGSASASEIVSGAVQDSDRGYIVGRRSFGKGLVQEQYRLPDGSALRLTVARYYTPSGRCIQKSYLNGEHDHEIRDRIASGELFSKDSIKQDLDKEFKTNAGRTVFGGGGIVPDIFVPVDSLNSLDCFPMLNSRGLISQISIDLASRFRVDLESFDDAKDYAENFAFKKQHLDFIGKFIEESGLDLDHDCTDINSTTLSQIKANAGRQLYGNEAFYRVVQASDGEIETSLDVLQKMDKKYSSISHSQIKI